MKKFLPSLLSGLLFSLIAPLSFYVLNPQNWIYTAWQATWRSTLISLAFFVVFYALGYLLTHNVDAAGLLAAVLVLGVAHLWQIGLVVGLLFLALIAVFTIAPWKLGFARLNGLLAMLGLILAGVLILQLGSILSRIPAPNVETLAQPVAALEPAARVDGQTPDIYYIVLDGYGRADVLSDVYGYDNSAFIEALRSRGFRVPPESRANYALTVLSLSSSLNMQYLDTMAAAMGDTPSWWPIETMLQHSQARDFLESNGYRTVFLASGFDFTDIRDGDEYLSPFPVTLSNFETGYMRFTGLSALEVLDGFISYPSYSSHRRYILGNFDHLQQAADLPGPKFVFAHIIAPHPPFVFDEQGDPVDPDYPNTMADQMRLIADSATYKQSYIAELEYVSQELLSTLDAILAASPAPPVILLQADHGPGLHLDSESAAASCLYERYSIFSAFLLPGVPPETVPETVTPVNSFRLVFNTYFGTDFDLLPDRQYFSPLSHFYTFEDVTDEIGSACAQDPVP